MGPELGVRADAFQDGIIFLICLHVHPRWQPLLPQLPSIPAWCRVSFQGLLSPASAFPGTKS